MGFFQQLCEQTQTEQRYLLSAPVIQQALDGSISIPLYQAFLTQAYHHVKHTVPLLMRAGSRMQQQDEWLRKAIIEYINEEYGHERWILNDIKATGADPQQVAEGQPHTATEAMVALVYQAIDSVHPAAFFGMAHVLEGTSVQLATRAAGQIKASLGLPTSAFSYLLSHGDLDIEHVKFFEDLMDKVTDPAAQRAIIQTAKHVYRLYGDMFRALPELAAEPLELAS
ncbi:long-chain fatty acid--CoA ligase [Pseudidiomarina atlantica]|jgi:pyrroloquinoline quinone (PQQ) biosynthesis protein C|uniref:Long-chain fatty acid--CoA ligase n=1 Tax=Pseudidiomarina atlantica TaxID=1517416 RepID=A0A094L2D4_9GAMM|nr:iron-containing redox enzyme family protein [Pseudidiomarina atlantica]KFZ28783.1 long-chain fatty acid--CoA ligase [Pseudidiomarina atlantica]